VNEFTFTSAVTCERRYQSCYNRCGFTVSIAILNLDPGIEPGFCWLLKETGNESPFAAHANSKRLAW